MFRRILILILVIVLVVSCFYAYKNYMNREHSEDGSVRCVGCLTPEREAAFKRENAGEGADGQSEHKFVWNGTEQDRHHDNTTYQDPDRPRPEPSYDGSVRPGQVQDPSDLNRSRFNDPNHRNGSQSSTYPPPPTYAGDTIPPNPPNGMAFTGRGTYQWYREGNLTWRLNTETGSSCIAYATLEEWRKPLVSRNGCNTRG